MRTALVLFCGTLSTLAAAGQAFGQYTARRVDALGAGASDSNLSQCVLMKIPKDSILTGRDRADEPVVAQLHCTRDQQRFVILPSGEMTIVGPHDAAPTARPFQPATKEELASLLTKNHFRGFKTKQTRRFLYVYNSSDLFYQGTSRILETMYPGLLAWCKKNKLDAHEAELPLVVVMFRTQAEFDQYRKMPDGVVAYYDGRTNWVCMYEMSKLAQVAPTIALKQAVSTVAHEGVHQILQNIGVQQRLSRWPMWISEGLPEFFSPTDITSDVRWKGVGTVNDLRMAELEQYIKAGQGKVEAGNTIRQTIRANNLTSTGYASAWALTHFLSQKRPANFPAFLQEVSQREPLEQHERDVDEALFVKHFGDDYSGLESLELKHLQGLPYVNPLTKAGLRPR